jgi:hypothetical protein
MARTSKDQAMHRLITAQSKREIIAIVRDYVHDWDPGAPGFNQTERFIVEQARARLAALDEKPESLPLASDLREAIAFDVEMDQAVSGDILATSPIGASR